MALNAKWDAASWVCFVSEAARSLARWKLPRKEAGEYVRAGTILGSGHDMLCFDEREVASRSAGGSGWGQSVQHVDKTRPTS